MRAPVWKRGEMILVGCMYAAQSVVLFVTHICFTYNRVHYACSLQHTVGTGSVHFYRVSNKEKKVTVV